MRTAASGVTTLRLAVCALVLAVGALVGVPFSSAEFTDTSTTQTRIGAARDWTGPLVAVDHLGDAVNGTVSVSVTASDAETSVVTVLIEVAPQSSSSWTTLCTATQAPWACPWDTTTMADGTYRVRATATDVDGNTTTSAEVTTEVANAPRVVLHRIPSPARGVITLTATFHNSGSWSVSMRFQAYVAGLGWVDVLGCGSAAGTVRTCSYDTNGLANGSHDFRVVAVRSFLLITETYYDSQVVLVDNANPAVSQTVPSGYLSGTVSWTATATDAHSGVASVLFEHRPTGGAWATCATDTTAPYACPVDTTALAEGGHEFRATATDRAGNAVTTPTVTRTVDNAGPEVTLTVPTGPLTGSVALSATASDAGAGMDHVQFQYRLLGAPSWTNCGVDYSAPYSCTIASPPNGDYEFRAVATDLHARTTTTAVETRTVDNVVASVAVTAPAAGSTIWGSTTVVAAASSNRGVASVDLQYRRIGGSWTSICTDAEAPYSCAWDPSTMAYGGYELRAVMAHGAGLSLTSATVAVVVPQPGGHDVQGTTSPDHGAGSGDSVTLTYTDLMDLSTIASGLTTASPVATTVTLSGGLGTTSMSVAGANLGSIGFGQQYVDPARTVQFAATVSATTATVNGITVTRITVTLGNRTGGQNSDLNHDTTTRTMSWSPSSAAKDVGGNNAATTAVAESGAADRDL